MPGGPGVCTLWMPRPLGKSWVPSARAEAVFREPDPIFLIPGRGDTLRINGRARLVRDAPFFDETVVKGHRPLLAIVVQIDEIFHHCSKAFLRSQLWDAATWDPGRDPRRAVIAQLCERPGDSIEELDAYYDEATYARGLYA